MFALEPEHIGGDEQRLISVDWKIVEVNGKVLRELPKGRKRRTTIYPEVTPTGYPLAQMLARRAAEVTAEVTAGRNPLGLMFPAPRGGWFRYSNFANRYVNPAFLLAGWRQNADDDGPWTWHSLRHSFCTTALNDWHLDITDVSALAGHSNTRITMEMYLGSTAGALDRALEATSAA